jgi:phosphoribosylformimino-5-aminoimidazole carboxamide ribotide isomerase
MELIPVLDLAHGSAVQARGGDRRRYAAVASVLTPGIAGDPLALLQAYRDVLGARECYVADLDAIQGGEVQRGLLGDLARAGPSGGLLLDAGVADTARALEALRLGAARVVVGLETLRSFGHLASILAAAGPERVVFSLDLRLGRPVIHPSLPATERAGADALSLAAHAVGAGAVMLLVLDLGRVGTGRGVDLDLLATLRRRFPSQRFLAGGGVGGPSDLERLRQAGCDGVLVATALHTGKVRRADFRAMAAPLPTQSSASTSR